jgi:C-terminal processing protease CtpA/Prc
MQDSVKSFTRVLSIVERNYADPVDVDKAIYDGAIPERRACLTQHQSRSSPVRTFREEQQGKYYGVGMTVQGRDNQTIVLALFVG